jgi:hypothetical protein
MLSSAKLLDEKKDKQSSSKSGVNEVVLEVASVNMVVTRQGSKE